MRKSNCLVEFDTERIQGFLSESAPNVELIHLCRENSRDYASSLFSFVETTVRWVDIAKTLPSDRPRRYWSGQDLIVAMSNDGLYIGQAQRAWLKTENRGLVPLHRSGGLPNDKATWRWLDMATVPNRIVSGLAEWKQGHIHTFVRTAYQIWGMNPPDFSFQYEEPLTVTPQGDIVLRVGSKTVKTVKYPWTREVASGTPWREANSACKARISTER